MDEAEPVIRLPDGRVVTGKKLSFRTLKEDWNEYELEDGSKLYVKLVLIDVIRRDQFNEIGEPVYQILSQNAIKVKVSRKAVEEVKKRLKKEKQSPEVS